VTNGFLSRKRHGLQTVTKKLFVTFKTICDISEMSLKAICVK
jgi:hypothetical protein